VSLKAKFAESSRARAASIRPDRREVEHGVIQIERQLKALDGLAMEAVSKERLDTFGLRNCRSRQRRVQLTSSNPKAAACERARSQAARVAGLWACARSISSAKEYVLD